MKIKGLIETFTDYKKNSLLILSNFCNFKCESEGLCGLGICQNSHLNNSKTIDISNKKIIRIFNNNSIVNSIIIGGLEPFLQFDEIYSFIKEFRGINKEDIVIFTGYYPNEIQEDVNKLKEFDNIIIKFGRFIEDSESKYDGVLGITLASSNQFAKKIEDL